MNQTALVLILVLAVGTIAMVGLTKNVTGAVPVCQCELTHRTQYGAYIGTTTQRIPASTYEPFTDSVCTELCKPLASGAKTQVRGYIIQ